jgi:Icc-related predicted phosphoesterase
MKENYNSDIVLEGGFYTNQNSQLKIHFISDTHTRHSDLQLPGGDVLVHCGDFMGGGSDLSEVIDFLDWLSDQDYKHKVFIAGNHDSLFEENPKAIKMIISDYPKITYLQDSEVIIDGIKFYGTPWTPEFCNWSFAYDTESEADLIFNKIPKDTDILLTHGPAFGFLDVVEGQNTHLGCVSLCNHIDRIKPKVHACGHIHSGFGIIDGYGEATTRINASCLNEKYISTNSFIELSI